jgi:hypothetical protein
MNNALSRYWSSGAISCAAHDPESLESSILVNIVKHMGKGFKIKLTRIALASQKMAERKAKATSAFHL